MPDPLPWDHFRNRYAVEPKSRSPVHILGAGLAGCWMARTLAEACVPVVVLEAGNTAASGASSNPAGIVRPYVTRSPGLEMSFHLESYHYLLEKLAQWKLSEACEHTSCGVVHLVDKPYPSSPYYKHVPNKQMPDTLGLPAEHSAIAFDDAGWLNPSLLCATLLQHELIELRTQCEAQSIERSDDDTNDDRWQINISAQAPVHASNLVITTGTNLNHFTQTQELPITPARGQISRFALRPGAAQLKHVLNGKHYLIPDADTIIAGATFERGVDENGVRPDDDAQNLAGLRATSNSLGVEPDAVESYAGVRATTSDRFPIAGPLPDMQQLHNNYADLHHGRRLHAYPSLPTLDGMYVLGGLGSRGIVTAPFTASLLSDFLLGGDEILQWSSLINPARFAIRALRKRQKNTSSD